MRPLAIFFALIILLIPAGAGAESKNFPVPDIIKPNVAFWIRIYTEVSLKEGLLHDRDYPQIVYAKLQTGDRTGKARSDYIEAHRKVYVGAIAAVRDSAPEKWDAAAKRVAEMFKTAPEGAIADAEDRIRHQTGQRERFRLGLERSGTYIDTIAAILKQHGVPDELKYLPHVESSFDADAYSKAGAAGLWQFMRATGRGYMKIDYMFDERRDAIISSHAAAKFLRANYDLLQRWPLAVTAYNHGPNGMKRAVETVGSREIADILQKHESPSFQFASKNFYSCFIAVLQIMENPEKYFKNIKYRPKFQATSVVLPSAMAPRAIIAAAGVSEQDFKNLNPGLRPVVFQQQRAIPAGHHVNLPHTINGDEALAAMKRTAPPLKPTPSTTPAAPATAVAAARESTRESREREREREKRAIDTDGGYYTVVRGDNLHNIAKSLGVSMNDLAQANNITNSSRIYVGQVLHIPSSSELAAAVPTPVKVDTAAVAASSTPKPIKVDTVVTASSAKPIKVDTLVTASSSTPIKADTAAAAPPSKAPKISDIRIRVTSSYDTTWTRPVDTTRAAAAAVVQAVPPAPAPSPPAPSAIKEETATATPAPIAPPPTPTPAPDTISTAAALREAETIPAAATDHRTGKPVIDTRFDANVYDLGVTVAPGGSSVRVRISVGETVGHLAEWMRVYTEDIRRLNNLEPGSTPPIGRTVSIPVTSSTNIQRFEVNRLQYHMAIEEDFFARYDVVDFDQRRVKSGDNLWKLSAEAKVPMWLIKKFNRKVNFNSLHPGHNLWIPRTGAKDSAHEIPEELEEIMDEAGTAEVEEME
jgi:membrane-bound lytic murein transglycosylase D